MISSKKRASLNALRGISLMEKRSEAFHPSLIIFSIHGIQPVVNMVLSQLYGKQNDASQNH